MGKGSSQEETDSLTDHLPGQLILPKQALRHLSRWSEHTELFCSGSAAAVKEMKRNRGQKNNTPVWDLNEWQLLKSGIFIAVAVYASGEILPPPPLGGNEEMNLRGSPLQGQVLWFRGVSASCPFTGPAG